MDAFAGRSSIFGGRDTTIGKINGKKVDADAFMRRVSEISKRQGFEGENGTAQAVNGLWQQELTDKIMGEQYEELGITVSDKELDQLLFGPNPPQEFRQAFGNPQDPQSWDPAMVRQQYNQIKKSGTPEQKAQLDELIDYIEKQTLLNKYNALLTNSVYIPKWFLEKRNVDNSQVANVSFVSVPYTTIADSAVKVSDADINDYIKAHQRDFDQKEESRSISYVAFSAAPSAADSAAVRNQLLSLKDSFQRTSNVQEFLVANRSLAQYNETYVSDKDLNLQSKDSIFKAPVGIVSGPLVEQDAMLLTKILDKKTQPDTVKVRHILIALNPQSATGQPGATRDSVTAKRLADSVQQAIAAGASFDSLSVKLSDDAGSKFRGGVYDSITRQTQFVPEFKDFAFNNPVGAKGVVKTQFGYHYMEVLSQKGSSPVYKLALFALPIEASSETQSQASNEANMFAGNVKDEKSFNDYFEKNLKAKGYQKMVAANLHPMDFFVTGVNGSARELVKDVFKADKGDVISPSQPINNSYLVALVTDITKPGVPSASSVRTMLEPVLRNRKKAELIKKQMGAVTDLNAVASKFNQPVQPADSLHFAGGGALGYETKVLGAIFNPANKGKVCPEGIAGQAGVYAFSTNAVYTVAVENADIEQQRRMLEMQSRQMFRSPVEVLQKKATIKDYRSNFY
ncbi:MAG TPA: peptidylprolyl isomerase, partial [Flavisolibacter sp.]|nr:peptidylprolyl isomerase [Flavisolibacter sp.]